MAIVVEHEKRKREILEKSFQLFIEDGYEDVTYQKIADKCGITRTTLYIYFKNKREIFLWSIKQLTNDVEQELIGIIKNSQIDSIECLKLIFWCIIVIAERNRAFFRVLKMYLMQLEKSGVDINDRVTRRVIRIQHLMNMVLIRGQKKDAIQNLPIKEINSLLYCLLETSIFRLGILNHENLDEILGTVQFVIEQFRTEKKSNEFCRFDSSIFNLHNSCFGGIGLHGCSYKRIQAWLWICCCFLRTFCRCSDLCNSVFHGNLRVY